MPILSAQQKGALDITNFVVVGGGWSAGFSNLQLSSELQLESYPSLMAEAMGTVLPQPLFRPLGRPAVISIDHLPETLPSSNQSVLRNLPFPLFVFNVSIPLIKISESLYSRPSLPIVQEGDYKQTMLNLVLGYPALILDEPPVWTQAEYAAWMSPTLIIVHLGYGDILEGLLEQDPGLITPPQSFERDYREVVNQMAGTYAQMVLVDIPNPLDSAYLSTVDEVAEDYSVEPEQLIQIFGIQADDRITIGGLVEIGDYFEGRRGNLLSSSSVIRSEFANQISLVVDQYNSAIRNALPQRGDLFSLNQFVREVREEGIQAGSYQIGGRHLEGFYSPDGLFPSPTGQALMANEMLSLLNTKYNAFFSLIDIQEIADRDFNVPKNQVEQVKRERGESRIPVPTNSKTRNTSRPGREN
jgi:hypothetical protein